MLRKLGVFVIALLPHRVASAQLCTGDVAFRHAPIHVAMYGAGDNTARGFAADVVFGIRGFMGDLGAGVKRYEAFGFDSRVTRGGTGYDPFHNTSRLHVCPTVSWISLNGPKRVGPGASSDYHESIVVGGLSAGYVLTRGKLWEVVPTAAL